MKRKLFFSIMISLVVLTVTSVLAENFQPADLEGTWYQFDTTVDPSIPAVYWTYGEFESDASGNIVSGAYYAPDGGSFSVTDGQMIIDNKGVMSGTATVALGPGITATAMFPHGKLDQAKTNGALLSLMTVDGSPPSMGVGTFIKGGGIFAQADLEGEWHGQGTMIDLTEGAVIPVSGIFNLDPAGNVTNGSYTAPNGIVATIVPAGSKLEVDGDGLVSGTVKLSVDFCPPPAAPCVVPLVGVIARGKMDQKKRSANLVTRDFVDPTDPTTLLSLTSITLVKGGGTFAATELAGAWHTYSLAMDYSDIANPLIYWVRGQFHADNSGNISSGYYVGPDETVINAVGGTVFLDNHGVINGNIILDEEGQAVTMNVNGQLDQGKTYGIFGSIDATGYWNGMTTGVMIKDTYSFPWPMFLPAITRSPTSPPTCNQIAGDWSGSWSEISCDGARYSGSWTGQFMENCTFKGTDNWDHISGTINPATMIFTGRGTSREGCGTISMTGVISNNDTLSGNYSYNVGGDGSFKGWRIQN